MKARKGDSLVMMQQTLSFQHQNKVAGRMSGVADDAKVERHDQFVRVSGGQLFVRDWTPSGPPSTPIVLLHDSLGCVEMWRDFPEQLSASSGRRVIAYDRLGFGKSDAHHGRLPLDFIYDEWRRSVVPLLNGLGLERAILFGHSVGGGMAIAAAAEIGEKCAGLITESAQVLNEEKTFASIREARAVFAPGNEAYAKLSRYHGDKTDWVVKAWTENWLDPGFDLDLRPAMKALRCPVLALHGDGDEYGSLKHPDTIAEFVGARKTVIVLAGCGHVPHREQRQRVLDAVTKFLGSSAQ